MKWTEAELVMLQLEFADSPTRELAAKLGRTRSAVDQAANKLGLHKSPEQRARSQAETNAILTEAGRAFRRRPGEAPWNKGRPHNPPGSERGRFKSGNKPQTWVPIGTERTNKDGLRVRKVAD